MPDPTPIDELRAATLQLDVCGEGARALHRVVHAMHDGHCPACGHLAPSPEFEGPLPGDHSCPECGFAVTYKEADAALQAFAPHFRKSVEVFERWRRGEPIDVTTPPPSMTRPAPTPMTAAELAASRQRCEAATPEPWRLFNGYGPLGDGLHRVARIGTEAGTVFISPIGSEDIAGSHADFEFVAHARTETPRLHATIEALQAEVERLRGELADAPDTYMPPQPSQVRRVSAPIVERREGVPHILEVVTLNPKGPKDANSQ